MTASGWNQSRPDRRCSSLCDFALLNVDSWHQEAEKSTDGCPGSDYMKTFGLLHLLAPTCGRVCRVPFKCRAIYRNSSHDSYANPHTKECESHDIEPDVRRMPRLYTRADPQGERREEKRRRQEAEGEALKPDAAGSVPSRREIEAKAPNHNARRFSNPASSPATRGVKR